MGEEVVVPLEAASVEIMKMVEVAMIVTATGIVMATGMTGTINEMKGARREVRLPLVFSSVFYKKLWKSRSDFIFNPQLLSKDLS